MAGHNKWSKVKHIKASVDAKRAKLFSQFSKEITIAARLGGGDPDMNPRLRTAVNSAKKQSMPSDNIERAIKKGIGDLDGDAIEEILYEGYGPQGSAFLVQAATDNKNRSAADVRSAFNKNHGSIGTPNSVAYNFQHIGEIQINADQYSEEQILEVALEAGAEDILREHDHHLIHTPFPELYKVLQVLESHDIQTESAQHIHHPNSTVQISQLETADQILQLYSALDQLDDVQNVYANFDIDDQILQQLDH